MAHAKERRQLVVEARERGEGTYSELAKRFGIGEASVSRWLRVDRETGRREALHGGGNPGKIGEEERQIVKAIVDEQNDRTLNEIADEYERRTGVKVSPSAISRALKKLKYTRKKKTRRAIEQGKEETQAKRKRHVELLRKLGFEHLIFLDEMGTNLKMTPTYARSERNTRAHDIVPGGYSRNVSVIGTLNSSGVLCTMTLEGGFNGPAFLAYLQNVLVPHLTPGKIIVMDNVRFHSVPGVAEALEAAGCTALYQPPYSPDLNPIEECWSKMKAMIRKAKARTREALDTAVARAAEAVTPGDAAGWFRHALVAV